jgi:transcriptional regulator GlxA family with amidase domain
MNRFLRIVVSTLAALALAACGGPPQTSLPAASPAAPEPTPQEPTTGAAAAGAGLPGLPTDRPLQAGFLVLEGTYNSELAAPYDILHHTVFHTRPGIEVFTVSPDGLPITTFEGLHLTPRHSFATAPEVDILVVPSAVHNMDQDLENEELIRWVKETGERARFVMSLCDGAFVLAQAGLLDGHAVTTFPGDQPRFAQLFPHLDLRVNLSFVHSGKVLTSVGGAKSYDVALYLVDLLYGPQVAQGVGRGLVIPWPPALGAGPVYARVR